MRGHGEGWILGGPADSVLDHIATVSCVGFPLWFGYKQFPKGSGVKCMVPMKGTFTIRMGLESDTVKFCLLDGFIH